MSDSCAMCAITPTRAHCDGRIRTPCADCAHRFGPARRDRPRARFLDLARLHQTSMTAPKTERPLLLVVDDEIPVLKVVERLAREGRVRRRRPAPAAPRRMRTLLRKPADLAMVDLRMPDVNGLDLLRQIRATVPGCEVILMTGLRRRRQRRRGDQARRARVSHQAVRLRSPAAGARATSARSSSGARRSSRSRARWRGSSSSAACSAAVR